jgi:hypothetical protein
MYAHQENELKFRFYKHLQKDYVCKRGVGVMTL